VAVLAVAVPGPAPSGPAAELPDPLRLADGSEVKTAADWTLRRKQMEQVIQDNLTGHAPPPPPDVRAELIRSYPVLEGKAEYRLVRLNFGPDNAARLDVALFVPARGDAPPPTIVFLGFTGTPGDAPPSAPDPKYRPISAEEFARQRKDVLTDGYAILTYYYQQAAADHDHNRSTGFFPAYPGWDWGTLSAWAWSASRCVDYLLKQGVADPGCIVLVGHSRLGKAALIAGALDQRFALVVPAASGCGGTGALRISGRARGGKEGLEEATARFPYWFSPRLRTFAGRVEQLPFDANWLIALIAPRPMLDLEARDDPYCNGPAAVASFRAARPVYRWLNAEDRIDLHFRDGGHALTDGDWATILDFADRQLRPAPGPRAAR